MHAFPQLVRVFLRPPASLKAGQTQPQMACQSLAQQDQAVSASSTITRTALPRPPPTWPPPPVKIRMHACSSHLSFSQCACRWVHVVTTRYTFVNTLQLLGPDARLDNQTAITLAEHEPQRAGSAGSVVSISQDLAELDGQTMDSITGGN